MVALNSLRERPTSLSSCARSMVAGGHHYRGGSAVSPLRMALRPLGIDDEGGVSAAYRREIDAAPGSRQAPRDESKLNELRSPFRTLMPSKWKTSSIRDTRPLLVDFVHEARRHSVATGTDQSDRFLP